VLQVRSNEWRKRLLDARSEPQQAQYLSRNGNSRALGEVKEKNQEEKFKKV
jgi:hypothetical protein